MSLNPNFNLKIQLGAELRKVSKAPESFSELTSLLSVLYNRNGFSISYQDEEGDFISLTTDEELKNLYQRNIGKPSIKLHLKETSEKKQESVFERIENLKKSLLESVSDSQPDVIDENTQNSFNSIENLTEDPCEIPVRIEQKDLIENPTDFVETIPEEEKTPQIQIFPVEKKPAKDKKVAKEKKQKEKKKPAKEKKQAKKSKIPQVVHENITCDSCETYPICGIRYKCTVCYDYDLCENCEESINHSHPLVKIRTPMKTGSQAIWSGLNFQSIQGASPHFEKIKEFIGAHIKEITKKKYKVKVSKCFHSSNIAVLPGTNVKFHWELMNKGRVAWPEGTLLVMKKGDFLCQDVKLPRVEPGEKCEIVVVANSPNIEKKCTGVWKILLGEKEFGKIRASANTILDPKIKTLVGMGFTIGNAKKALESCADNIELAISQILRN